MRVKVGLRLILNAWAKVRGESKGQRCETEFVCRDGRIPQRQISFFCKD